MVWFGIPDRLIFLSWSLPVLLVAGTPIMAVSCVLASVAKTLSKSMDRTTSPKVDKIDISSAEGPTAQALVAKSRSKASDDAPIDDNPNLLNFVAVVSWVGC
jgi:hypothetical protein